MIAVFLGAGEGELFQRPVIALAFGQEVELERRDALCFPALRGLLGLVSAGFWETVLFAGGCSCGVALAS